MFFASKSILGSFSYLFGSLLFGAVTYFDSELLESLFVGLPPLLCIIGTSAYLMGGILFISAAIEPWMAKTVEFEEIHKDVQDLKRTKSVVGRMTGTRSSKAHLSTRMSTLGLDAKSMLSPNEIELMDDKKKKQCGNADIMLRAPHEIEEDPEEGKDIFDIVADSQSPFH